VANEYGLFQAQLANQPLEVVGEAAHRVAVLGRVALAVPAEVGRDDRVAQPGEVLELRGEVRVIATPPMDEHQRPLGPIEPLVSEGHPAPDR
jgi:hypothetical protein